MDKTDNEKIKILFAKIIEDKTKDELLNTFKNIEWKTICNRREGVIFETTIGKFESAEPEYAIIDEEGCEVEELNDGEDEFTFDLSCLYLF